MIRVPYSLWLAAGAALVAAAATPLSMALARRVGAIAHPGPRHPHAEPTPRMGGLAMIVAVLGVAWLARALPGPAALLDARPLLGFTLACVPILMLGVVDDIRGASPLTKLAVQACAALVLVQFGYGVPVLTNPFGGTFAAGWLSAPLTVAWVLAVTNAVNLIDGLDGLAAGVVAIAAATLWATGRMHQDFYVMYLGALLIGASLGFLAWNFPPARVFMGDTGSQFLGLALAAATLLENRKGTATVTLLFPLVALGVPIVDSVLAFVRRLVSGAPPFRGDSGHIHHRLVRLGLSPRAAVFMLWALCAVCGVLAIAFTSLPRREASIAVAGLAALLFGGFELVEYFDRRRGGG